MSRRQGGLEIGARRVNPAKQVSRRQGGLEINLMAWPVGCIPKNWQVKRLKNISTYNDESLDENTDPDFELEYVSRSS